MYDAVQFVSFVAGIRMLQLPLRLACLVQVALVVHVRLCNLLLLQLCTPDVLTLNMLSTIDTHSLQEWQLVPKKDTSAEITHEVLPMCNMQRLYKLAPITL